MGSRGRSEHRANAGVIEAAGPADPTRGTSNSEQPEALSGRASSGLLGEAELRGNVAAAEALWGGDAGTFTRSDEVITTIREASERNREDDHGRLVQKSYDLRNRAEGEDEGARTEADALIGRVQRDWQVVHFFEAEKILESVLEAGRFNNFWELGTSGGISSATRRDQAEIRMGYDAVSEQAIEDRLIGEAEAALDRPVYAMFFVGDVPAAYPRQHGSSRAHLDRSAGARVSLLHEDSMEAGSATVSDFAVIKRPESMLANLKIDKLEPILAGDPLRLGYIEAQIHGGMGIDDISEIVLSRAFLHEARELVDRHRDTAMADQTSGEMLESWDRAIALKDKVRA